MKIKIIIIVIFFPLLLKSTSIDSIVNNHIKLEKVSDLINSNYLKLNTIKDDITVSFFRDINSNSSVIKFTNSEKSMAYFANRVQFSLIFYTSLNFGHNLLNKKHIICGDNNSLFVIIFENDFIPLLIVDLIRYNKYYVINNSIYDTYYISNKSVVHCLDNQFYFYSTIPHINDKSLEFENKRIKTVNYEKIQEKNTAKKILSLTFSDIKSCDTNVSNFNDYFATNLLSTNINFITQKKVFFNSVTFLSIYEFKNNEIATIAYYQLLKNYYILKISLILLYYKLNYICFVEDNKVYFVKDFINISNKSRAKYNKVFNIMKKNNILGRVDRINTTDTFDLQQFAKKLYDFSVRYK